MFDMTPCESFLFSKKGSLILMQLVLIIYFIQKYNIYYIYIYLYICIYVYIYTYMQVFDTLTQPFSDTRKTLYLKEPLAKLLKTYFKDKCNIYFVVV